MILFQLVVKIFARPVLYFSTQYRAYGTWVGVVSVGGYLVRFMTHNLSGFCEEALGCVHIPMLREHGIYPIAITIYCPVEVAPFASDLHIDLVDVPRPTSLTLAPTA